MRGEQESQPLLLAYEEKPKKTILDKIKEYKQGITTQTILVAIYTLLYVITGVINSIYLKKTFNSFANYGFYVNQVTNYGYIPIFGSVVLFEVLFTKLITAEQRRFPWYKFLIMGAIDALNGYIVVIGGVSTSGPLAQLLNQAIIPVTMVASFFFLKERYTIPQLLGALVIVGGVIISLYPSLANKGGNTGNILFFNLFYLTQAIPFAASNIYKDIAFKSVDMDVWYLQFWDVFYQSLIGTLLFPINAILPKPANMPFSEIPGVMKNAWQCTKGDNTITTNCGTDELPCDDCHGAIINLLIYIAINVTYNVFILLVIKHGSATILSICQTIRLPLTNICFSQGWIMGDYKIDFNNLSIVGLVVILVGLVGYRVGSLVKKKTTDGVDGDGSGDSKIIPRFGPGGSEVIMEAVKTMPLIIPKTDQQQRSQYFTKLGILTVASSTPSSSSPFVDPRSIQ
eukprot:TRINITY_DN5521_c0_g1_i1.p1 TRINITY_DN5521_c0_g1~~TRINITY_DN5521_c0_g1_i1.p1  ORF type:complete len:456 (+),score=94.86 TRINITY_DN5521_c0_g1_i1:190-1557(+)